MTALQQQVTTLQQQVADLQQQIQNGGSGGGQQPTTCGTVVTDYDGNGYSTVQIGNQCWMKNNMRTTHYSDGTSIPQGSNSLHSNTSPYRYYPDNDYQNVSTYGYLYNWTAATGGTSTVGNSPVQGICPTGWHIPSHADWLELTNYVSSQSAYICGTNAYVKALASTTGWNSGSYISCSPGNSPSTNNATGFSAVPAGEYQTGSTMYFGDNACFWSSTAVSDNSCMYCYLQINGYQMTYQERYRDNGYSVRCLKNN